MAGTVVVGTGHTFKAGGGGRRGLELRCAASLVLTSQQTGALEQIRLCVSSFFPPPTHCIISHRTKILSLAQLYHQSTNPSAVVLD